MSMESKPDNASEEPKMEGRISPIEDALRQASEELSNAASNINKSTTCTDITDQEDDFEYLEIPKEPLETSKLQKSQLQFKIQPPPLLNYLEDMPQNTEKQDQTLRGELKCTSEELETKPSSLGDELKCTSEELETKPSSLGDEPKNTPKELETKPSSLRDGSELAPSHAENKPPTIPDDPKQLPEDSEIKPSNLQAQRQQTPRHVETQPPTLREEPSHGTRQVEAKPPSVHNDSESIPNFSEPQPSTSREELGHVSHDAEMQTQIICDQTKEGMSSNKVSTSQDTNKDSSGHPSKKIFGVVLVGAAIIVLGVIIYKNFKSTK